MDEKCLIESTDKLLLIRCGGKHAAVVWDSCREHYLSTKAKIIKLKKMLNKIPFGNILIVYD